MRFRAIAVAAERSNAVGTVELECTPHGLVINYLGVFAFSEGYAPAALTDGTQVTVGWSQIQQARVEGEQVFLEMTREVSPHNRLTLTRFSTGETAHQHEIYRRRVVLRVGVLGAAMLAAVLVSSLVPELSSSTAGKLGLIIGGLAAAAVLAAGYIVDRQWMLGGLDPDATREAFVADLSNYLPNLVRAPFAPATKKTDTLVLDLQGILPRTTAAVVITLTAGTLGALLTSRLLLNEDPELRSASAVFPESPRKPEPLPAAAPEPKAIAQAPTSAPATGPQDAVSTSGDRSAPALAEADAESTPQIRGRCKCVRSYSPLWHSAVPKLSVLVLDSHSFKRGSAYRLSADIAIVNNSDEELRDITLNVRFFERDPEPSAKRHEVSHRALFFEGPLASGQAIKWTTEARGTEFELENPVGGDIGPGGDGAAPMNRFYELLDANHRPVRMHGAMMLAYLGDPRAKQAVLTLQEALRENEAPYLRRLLQALGDVIACDFRVSGTGSRRTVNACLFNTSDEKQMNLGFKVNALEGPVRRSHPVGIPPQIVAHQRYPLSVDLEPQMGVAVQAELKLEDSNALKAEAFEILAGRHDLLQ